MNVTRLLLRGVPRATQDGHREEDVDKDERASKSGTPALPGGLQLDQEGQEIVQENDDAALFAKNKYNKKNRAKQANQTQTTGGTISWSGRVGIQQRRIELWQAVSGFALTLERERAIFMMIKTHTVVITDH